MKRVDPNGEGFVGCIKAVAELVKATAILSGRMNDMDAHAGLEDPLNHPKAIEQAATRVRNALKKVERSCGCAVSAAAAIATAKAAIERAGPYLLEAAEVGSVL